MFGLGVSNCHYIRLFSVEWLNNLVNDRLTGTLGTLLHINQ